MIIRLGRQNRAGVSARRDPVCLGIPGVRTRRLYTSDRTGFRSSRLTYRRLTNPAANTPAAAKNTPSSATVEHTLTIFVCMNNLQQNGERLLHRS